MSDTADHRVCFDFWGSLLFDDVIRGVADDTLERAGVVFIDAEEGVGGPGVRLKEDT